MPGCPILSLLLRKVGFHGRIHLRIFVPRDEVRPIDSFHNLSSRAKSRDLVFMPDQAHPDLRQRLSYETN